MKNSIIFNIFFLTILVNINCLPLFPTLPTGTPAFSTGNTHPGGLPTGFSMSTAGQPNYSILQGLTLPLSLLSLPFALPLLLDLSTIGTSNNGVPSITKTVQGSTPVSNVEITQTTL